MIGVGVVDRLWHVRDRLDGWLRTTGVRQEEWDRSPLTAWLCPLDIGPLRRMSMQMEHGAATAQLRIGPWEQWSPCVVECSRWMGDLAAISVRSMPPPERCAVAITDATRYLHIDSTAESILEAPAHALEGTPWSVRVHPMDMTQNARAITALCEGSASISAMLAMIRCGAGWKMIKSWAEPFGQGQTITRFVEVDAAQVLGQPLPSMVASGLRPVPTGAASAARPQRKILA